MASACSSLNDQCTWQPEWPVHVPAWMASACCSLNGQCMWQPKWPVHVAAWMASACGSLHAENLSFQWSDQKEEKPAIIVEWGPLYCIFTLSPPHHPPPPALPSSFQIFLSFLLYALVIEQCRKNKSISERHTHTDRLSMIEWQHERVRGRERGRERERESQRQREPMRERGWDRERRR